MPDLNSVVQIAIDRQTKSVARQAFGIVGIVGQFIASKTSETFTRARRYGSLAEMTADGWVAADKIYQAAQSVFSQNPSVNSIIVGRLDTNDADLAEGLTAIQDENSDWYAWMLISPGSDYADDIKAAVLWNEAQKKLFFYATSATTALSSTDTTSLPAFFSNAGNERAVGMYFAEAQDATPAGTVFPEGAWPGESLPFDPGSQTWAYKSLNSIPVDNLTLAQVSALTDKHCNYYVQIAGRNITRNGVVASGEWIDIIRGLDWLESRLQEEIFSNLINNRKVPYDDGGIALIENAIRGVLAEGVRVGLLLPNGEITIPNRVDISANDRNARNLPEVSFTVGLQGAIQKVSVQGTVTA